MENGSTMSKHLETSDGLVVGLQTLGEPVDEAWHLVVLLRIVLAEYEMISSFVENAQGVTINDDKEKLLKEYERLEKNKPLNARSSGRKHGSCSTLGLIVSGAVALSHGTLQRKRFGQDAISHDMYNNGGAWREDFVRWLHEGKIDSGNLPGILAVEVESSVITGSYGRNGSDGNAFEIWSMVCVDLPYFLKNESEVTAKLSEFKAFYENQWGERLQCLRSDNGTGSCTSERPQQNGVAERMNRTIIEKVRNMLHYKEGVHFCVDTAMYLINGSTITANSRTTPYELGLKTKPRMDHLREFGFQNVEGYRVYDFDASKIMVSRSVQLDEIEVTRMYHNNERLLPVQEAQQSVPDEPME
ncbi:Rve-domain-containing hypothetical protein [Phytophthora megakarya]|uniref:Integrase catalytic domain-containing protein n=1 Tax=Phytophthora megakarya TaxID=4795 RepID=A0A225WU97_9STRA|nr:Rve-domain-containing hypothetical protein [Phytophthora megakarya]